MPTPGNYSGGLWEQLFEKWFAQYGDHDRAVAAAKAEFDEITSQPSALSTFDQSTAGIADYLKTILSGGNPLEAQQRQAMQGEIGRATRRSITDTMSALSRSGLSRSGVGYGVLNDIYGNQANALAKGELGIAEMGLNQRNNAISQLLGLGQARGGFAEADKNAYYNAKGQAFQMQQQQRERKPTLGDNIGQIIPSVLELIGQLAKGA